MTEENLEGILKEDDGTQVLYDQLQSEYNKLLKQYAAAENTIDELRTGATVHLYTEPLESRPTSRLSLESARYPQNINFQRALQASTSEFSTMNDTRSTNFSSGGRMKTPTRGESNGENLSLPTRIQALKKDVNTVESVFSESGVDNEETLNELLVICKQLDKDHEILSRELKLQSRNALSAVRDGNDVSTKTELQKELHRIGLHNEEIQGDIIARLKVKKQKPAVDRLAENEKKGASDEKPALGRDLENLVKEMKDLKDLSIKNSEELLTSSKNENSGTANVSAHRRSPECKTDMLDSRYFTASPVNMDHAENTFSGSDGCEQTLNMTWPTSRNLAHDIGTLRHSFSETTTPSARSIPNKTRNPFHSATHHSMLSGRNGPNIATSYPESAERARKEHFSAESPRTSQHRSDIKTSQSEKRHSLNSTNIRKPYSEDETGYDSWKARCSEFERNNERGDDPVNSRAAQPSQEPPRYRLDRANHERNEPDKSTNTRQPSRDQTAHKKQPSHERHDLNTKKHHGSDEETRQDTQTPRRHNENCAERRVGSADLGARTFQSMSSIADSSRMSTPLFQPRRATRLSTHEPQAPRYKQLTSSDGFDSGFVGSEASRSSRVMTEQPDGVQKLNSSNQWDSTLHLDLVSEIDENDATSSPEQLSTTYELTAEDGRQSPRRKSQQLNEDIKFMNSCPSPPLSMARAPVMHAGYFGYRPSQNPLPSNSGNSSPVPNTSDPLLSHSNERPLSERRCSSGSEEPLRTRMDKRRIRRGSPGSRDVSPEVTAVMRSSGKTMKTERRTTDHNSARKLQSLRNELDSLHDHVNNLQHPRVILDMYDELRDHNEQLRRTDERRHDRKLDELRQTIEQLKKDVRSGKDQRKPERNTEFYDDFRSELRTATEKLNELSALRNIPETLPQSPSTSAVPPQTETNHLSSHDEEMAKRFSNLVGKVDQLRLIVENRPFDHHPETSQHFCRLCSPTNMHQCHGSVDQQPQTSTPFAPRVYQQRKQNAQLNHRFHQSTTFPGSRPPENEVGQQPTPVIHHIHTYHKGPELQEHYETDSDDEHYLTRNRRKGGPYRSRYRSRQDYSYRDHLSLDEARKAAWDVQRLSKNILNTISLDLTSLRS